MANDTETIRSILIFAGGALGFAGAVIAFVNSRLQRATTAAARYKLCINLLVGLESALWLGGFLAAAAFGSLRVGLWFIFFAYIVYCVLFLIGRGVSLRADILMLVICTGLLVVMFLLSIIDRLVSLQGRFADVLGHLVDVLSRK
jgi:hypothetical protein